ncbi:MAG: serine/threonine protein kinase [Polyangiaceae bacterium]|nr:serine/threonine protein kinase [Polyangiaceae bacterium]
MRASSIPPRRLPNPGDVVAGKFRLERLLKQGGMGAVWVATHLGLDELVALKFMDPRRVSSPEARIRFTREAKAAAQVRSKNIVQMLDHGVDDGVPYIAMELLSGEDLGARLRRVGRLKLVEAAALLDDIAHAMDRAHAAGIVHRDLKPENIFLAKDGDHEVPKILDFGIALEVQPDATDDSAATQEDVILGTPYFMSPEQVRGRTNIDHRSDLWSIGVILFRAVTGTRPFGRGAPADVIVQICSDPIPRASVVQPDLPAELDRFFEKALARDVAKRFSSAKEMAAAFAEIAYAHDTGAITMVDSTQRVRGPATPRKGPPPLPMSTPPLAEETASGGWTASPIDLDVSDVQLLEAPPAANASPVVDNAYTIGSVPETRDEVSTRAGATQSHVYTASAAQTPAPPVIADASSKSAGAAISDSAEATKRAEKIASAGGRGELKSRLWVGVFAAMATAAVLLFGFRDKLFAPVPAAPDPQTAATIVLSAGTVVLMGPAGRTPMALTVTPAATSAPTATAIATATTAATATAAPSASTMSTQTARVSTPTAPSTGSAAVTAKPITTSAPTAAPTPKATATVKKGEPDLGY